MYSFVDDVIYKNNGKTIQFSMDINKCNETVHLFSELDAKYVITNYHQCLASILFSGIL
jgi:hypothetical protein